MKNKKFTFSIDTILFIIFLILKLDGIIDWQWIWVFSPLWIVWAIQICITIVAVVIDAIVNREPKYKSYHVPSGSTLVWDPKTNTMYGPFDEVNE